MFSFIGKLIFCSRTCTAVSLRPLMQAWQAVGFDIYKLSFRGFQQLGKGNASGSNCCRSPPSATGNGAAAPCHGQARVLRALRGTGLLALVEGPCCGSSPVGLLRILLCILHRILLRIPLHIPLPIPHRGQQQAGGGTFTLGLLPWICKGRFCCHP